MLKLFKVFLINVPYLVFVAHFSIPRFGTHKKDFNFCPLWNAQMATGQFTGGFP